MNCEYCGRFLKDASCAGCGSPNPYLHRGDPIRLREYIEPRWGNYISTSGIYSTIGLFDTAGPFRRSFIETGYRSLFSGDFISPSDVLKNQGDA